MENWPIVTVPALLAAPLTVKVTRALEDAPIIVIVAVLTSAPALIEVGSLKLGTLLPKLSVPPLVSVPPTASVLPWEEAFPSTLLVPVLLASPNTLSVALPKPGTAIVERMIWPLLLRLVAV